MARVPTGEWEVTCTGEVFARVRSDPEFAFLLTLARMVNAVKFGVQTHRQAGGILTPVAERQRVGAQLFLAGLLHEILEFRKVAAKTCAHLDAFKRAFSVFDQHNLDSTTVELLDRIRNRAAFHFDASVALRSLPQLPAEPFAFLIAVGRDPMDSNYELADIITFGFIFEAPTNLQKLGEGLKEFRKQLDSLLLIFVKTADQLILERLLALEFTIKELESGSFAADRTEAE
jgi:hypothetical protein